MLLLLTVSPSPLTLNENTEHFCWSDLCIYEYIFGIKKSACTKQITNNDLKNRPILRVPPLSSPVRIILVQQSFN